MINAAIFLAVGCVIALLITPWVIRLARSGIGVDKPDDFRKKHDGAISRLGGISLMVAYATICLCTIGLTKHYAQPWWVILGTSELIFLLGLCDDFRPLGAKVKLIGQIVIALIAYSLGLSIDVFTHPSLTSPAMMISIPLGGWSIVLTVFWLIAIPNIVNLIDGIDGLAAGLGVFLNVTLGIVGLLSNQIEVAWVCFGMAGTLVGFLCFNLPPASIFLGDGGAYLIGFEIAAISLHSSNKGSIAAALLVVIVALGLPILDTFFAIVRRGFRGFPLFQPDEEHIHHRMLQLGFSRGRILLTMYALCVALSLIGLSLFWSQGRTLPMVTGALFILALISVRYLGYINRWGDFKLQAARSFSRRSDVQFAVLQGHVALLEVDRCETAPEFRQVLGSILNRAGLYTDPVPDIADDLCEIKLEFRHYPPWIVYARRDGHTFEHWKRLAECFRPAYRRALEKWAETQNP